MEPSQSESPAAPAQPEAHAAHSRALTFFVQAAIIITALVFISTVTLIFYRWVTVEVPSGTVIIHGGRELAGAEVIVTGIVLPEPMRQTIGPERNYSVQFFLHPGNYLVSVVMEEREVWGRRFDLPPEAHGWRVDLSQLDLLTTMETDE